MDIFDVAVIQPHVNEILNLLDFSKLDKARDDYAISIGQRWFKQSGAKELKESSKVNYNDYKSADENSIKSSDKIQIEKDLSRTKPANFFQKSLQLFLKDIYQDSNQLRRILYSICIRNSMGYAQGLDYIALFFTAFFHNEEDVFWLLSAILENLIPNDFYSPSPNSMNGFRVERQLLIELALLKYPELATNKYKDDFINSIEILIPKYYICLTIDIFPLEITCMIIQHFFYELQGHLGIIPLILYLIDYCKLELLNGNDMVMTLLSKQNIILSSIDHIKKAFTIHKYIYHDPILIKKLRTKCRNKFSNTWNISNEHLYELSNNIYESIELLQQYQLTFQAIYNVNKSGITLDMFKTIIHTSTTTCNSSIYLNSILIEKLFKLFDLTNTNSLNFCELMNCIHILNKGTFKSKLRLCFKLYDIDNNGFLTMDQIISLTESLSQCYLYQQYKTQIELDSWEHLPLAEEVSKKEEEGKEEEGKGVKGEETQQQEG